MRSVKLGILGSILGSLLFAGAAPSARAEDWSKTFQLSGKPQLAIETSDANIQLDTWGQNTIEARVVTERWKIGEGGITISDHQAGNLVSLEVRFPREFMNISGRHGHVDIQIHMPREGAINLHTADGSIEVHHLKGPMQLRSGDGHLAVDGVEGSLKAQTGDGHIDAAGRFDGLDVTTGDGRIDAKAFSGSTMGSDWRIKTGDGSVSLQLPENFAADVDLHTGDGHISVDVPFLMEGKVRENDIHGKLNGGGSLLTIQTGDGSIHLEKLSSSL
jgi:hypothetical protein